MFCKKCGKEIISDSKFCAFCGAEIEVYSQTQIRSTADNQQLTSDRYDRKVLITYLGNLRTLELTYSKLYEEKVNLERQANLLGGGSKPKISVCAWLWLVHLPYILLLFFAGSFIKNIFRAAVFGNILLVATLVLLIVHTVKYILKYITAVKKYNIRIAEENKEKRDVLQTLPHIKNDLNQNYVLLQDAYGLNIIPQKYRNIYAVYFLYEYMTTSNSTLSEALYQCAMDEISQKLDKVIRQQRDSLILSARLNALNERIVQQNDEILRRAIKIEKNTELSAQYSRIAAINTQTTNQLQCYYIFKNRY